MWICFFATGKLPQSATRDLAHKLDVGAGQLPEPVLVLPVDENHHAGVILRPRLDRFQFPVLALEDFEHPDTKNMRVTRSGPAEMNVDVLCHRAPQIWSPPLPTSRASRINCKP